MNKNYDFLTGDVLQARFPYMFNSKHTVGCEFYRGWMPILAGLCVEIEHMLGERREAFKWLQIKEKFGTGRFYYSLHGFSDVHVDLVNPSWRASAIAQVESDHTFAGVKQSIFDLVAEGSVETARSCMICGGQAKPRQYGSYILNLCVDHHPARIRQPDDQGTDAVWRLADAATGGSARNGGAGGVS